MRHLAAAAHDPSPRKTAAGSGVARRESFGERTSPVHYTSSQVPPAQAATSFSAVVSDISSSRA